MSRGNYDVKDLNLRRWPWQTFLCTPVKHRKVLCHRKHLSYKMYFPVLYKVQNNDNWKLYKIMQVVLFPWMSSSRRTVKKMSNMRDFIYDNQFKWKWIFSHCLGKWFFTKMSYIIISCQVWQKAHAKAKKLDEEYFFGRNSDIGNQIYFPEWGPFPPMIWKGDW